MNRPPVTPDALTSLVWDLMDLRDRVTRKDEDMEVELTQFRATSQELQKELEAVQELKREMQELVKELSTKMSLPEPTVPSQEDVPPPIKKTKKDKVKKCFHCGKASHLIKDCWYAPKLY